MNRLADSQREHDAAIRDLAAILAKVRLGVWAPEVSDLMCTLDGNCVLTDDDHTAIDGAS